MSLSSGDQTLQFIDKLWTAVYHSPGMFGSPDSIEGVMWTLLKVRHQIFYPQCRRVNCATQAMNKYVSRLFSRNIGLVGSIKLNNPNISTRDLSQELAIHMDNVREFLFKDHEVDQSS